ncbi:DUF3772 domain-containing protein [Sulfitobacter sp. LCG007]
MKMSVRRALAVLLLAAWGAAAIAQTAPQEDAPVQDPPSSEAEGQAEQSAPATTLLPLRGTAGDPVWEQLATRAERLIDVGDAASAQALESVRSQLVPWRVRFAQARDANSERIETLRAQIDALKPDNSLGDEQTGSFEQAPDIAQRREALEAQLAELLAPVQVAEAAYRRANGAIGEIDRIIRQQNARRLLSLGPSPLAPGNWATAIQETSSLVRNLSDSRAELMRDGQLGKARDNLPGIVFLLAVAVVFLFRGPVWADSALAALNRYAGHGTSVWTFLVSLFRIIIPLSGIVALVSALTLFELPSDGFGRFLLAIPIWGAILLGFRWLADRLFSNDSEQALIAMPENQRAKAHLYFVMLSYLFVLRGVMELLSQIDPVSPATKAVAAFPVVVLSGAALAALGQLLRKFGNRLLTEADADGPRLPARVLQSIGTSVIVVAAVAPVMAALGYAEAGNALLYPTIMTLLLLGLLLVLQRFFADLYGLLTRQGARARDALAPILIGFMLAILALPVLALIWGARIADLTEVWTRFQAGFTIGETTISPENFLTFLLVFAIGFSLTRLVQGTMRGLVLPRTRLDLGGQNALVSGLGYLGVFLAGLAAVTTAGIDLSALAFVAGALSLGVGFGLQNIVSNFVSGIILLVERPISEGDWIEVGGEMGYVRDISVRATRIETFDRTDVIVPNSDLVSGRVTNYTRGNTVGRLIVKIGVAYGSDTRKVETILREIAEAEPMVLANPPPAIVFDSFGDSALNFEIRAILRDVNWILSVKTSINHAIAERFREEGIEIPFPQRDLWLRNAAELKGNEK